MVIDFEKINETVIPNFNGGEKEYKSNMFIDENNKIIKGRLEPGASIGLHTHDAGIEVIFIISGTATFIFDDGIETVTSGMCHYCPKGHSHSMINKGKELLEFYAVVAVQ